MSTFILKLDIFVLFKPKHFPCLNVLHGLCLDLTSLLLDPAQHYLELLFLRVDLCILLERVFALASHRVQSLTHVARKVSL